jgi:hypothetical protein
VDEIKFLRTLSEYSDHLVNDPDLITTVLSETLSQATAKNKKDVRYVSFYLLFFLGEIQLPFYPGNVDAFCTSFFLMSYLVHDNPFK